MTGLPLCVSICHDMTARFAMLSRTSHRNGEREMKLMGRFPWPCGTPGATISARFRRCPGGVGRDAAMMGGGPPRPGSLDGRGGGSMSVVQAATPSGLRRAGHHCRGRRKAAVLAEATPAGASSRHEGMQCCGMRHAAERTRRSAVQRPKIHVRRRGVQPDRG